MRAAVGDAELEHEHLLEGEEVAEDFHEARFAGEHDAQVVARVAAVVARVGEGDPGAEGAGGTEEALGHDADAPAHGTIAPGRGGAGGGPGETASGGA